MEASSVLLAAIQSSFLLGLLHGINPCGHSWLVLAPFTTGVKEGHRVTLLTASFLGGTAVACLFLGASLGAISQLFPSNMGNWLDGLISFALILVGMTLLINPYLLHQHDHEHGHGNCCEHNHHHSHEPGVVAKLKRFAKDQKKLAPMLFVIGFVNMIVPCPTAAIMYGYALKSDSIGAATIVFGVYAFSTAIAVGGIIYLIFKATHMAADLQQDWVEPLIMRLAGGVIVIFSGYSLYSTFWAA